MSRRHHHKESLDRLVKKDPKFRALVEIHGMPTSKGPCSQSGDICMVGNCVDGKRLVVRCGPSMTCDQYTTEDC